MFYIPPYTQDLFELLRYSREEALRLGHQQLRPEHFLLALVRMGQDERRLGLEELDIDPALIRRDLNRLLERGRGVVYDVLSPDRDAARVIDGAWRIAGEMRLGFVSSEHLLLALIKDDHCLASQCLHRYGADFDQARLKSEWRIRTHWRRRWRFYGSFFRQAWAAN
jgi:ATP-dependent Clp protease ATP-binding subunit ClpC